MPHLVDRLWNDTWTPEYLTAGLSLASMASVVALLAAYDGQSISTWHLPYGITINAVISVLNTISRSLLAFALSATIGQWKWIDISQRHQRLHRFSVIDSASRGPLGSAQFLWHTNGRYGPVTILGLCIDFLTDSTSTEESCPSVHLSPY